MAYQSSNFLEDYEKVEDRIHAFWIDHGPHCRVESELLTEPSNVSVVVFRARIWTDMASDFAAEGHARLVTPEGKFPDKKAFERTESVAIGRALANLDYAKTASGDGIARPSREEMEDVLADERAESTPARPAPAQKSTKTHENAEIQAVIDSARATATNLKISPAQANDVFTALLGTTDLTTLDEGKSFVLAGLMSSYDEYRQDTPEKWIKFGMATEKQQDLISKLVKPQEDSPDWMGFKSYAHSVIGGQRWPATPSELLSHEASLLIENLKAKMTPAEEMAVN